MIIFRNKEITVNELNGLFLFFDILEMSARMETKIDASLIALEIQGKCCKNRCINLVSLGAAHSCRERFWKLNRSEQQQFIYSALEHSPLIDNRRMFTVSFKDIGTLCRKAWCTLYGISDSR